MKIIFLIILNLFIFNSTLVARNITCEPTRCSNGLAGPKYDSYCPPVDQSDVQGWALFNRCEKKCSDDEGNTWVNNSEKFVCCTDRSNTCIKY